MSQVSSRGEGGEKGRGGKDEAEFVTNTVTDIQKVITVNLTRRVSYRIFRWGWEKNMCIEPCPTMWGVG